MADVIRAQVVAPDGVRIAYRVVEPDTPDHRPPVVLQHGFAASTEVNWVAPGVLGALTAAGRRVVGVDARGHGASDAPHDPARYGEQRMADDLALVADALAAPSFDLVGYSMGSIVALLLAAQDTRVRRLVVGGVGESIVRLGGADTRSLSPRALIDGLQAPAARDVPLGVRPFRALVHATGNDVRALVAHAAVMHTAGIALDRITAATLVLDGRDDVLAQGPQLLADAIPGARVRLVAGDHMTAVLDPAFTTSIVAFVNHRSS